MLIKYWLLTSLIILSCYPGPKLEIIQDEFDDTLTYILNNNRIISSDKTHEIELNLQKSRRGPGSLNIRHKTFSE